MRPLRSASAPAPQNDRRKRVPGPVVVFTTVLLALIALIVVFSGSQSDELVSTDDDTFRLEVFSDSDSAGATPRRYRFRVTLPTFGRVAIYASDWNGRLVRVWPGGDVGARPLADGRGNMLAGLHPPVPARVGAPFTMALCATSVRDPDCRIGPDGGGPVCHGLCKVATAETSADAAESSPSQ